MSKIIYGISSDHIESMTWVAVAVAVALTRL
jgi:hypothetical protein